jgi:hypothetical protein
MTGIHGTATKLHLKVEKINGSGIISKINTSCLEYSYKNIYPLQMIHAA